MAGGAYDDRDGVIWMDGEFLEWREAKVHVLTHALHYASSVFEGERAYAGKIFKSHEHSERLIASAEAMDIPMPYSAEEITALETRTEGWIAGLQLAAVSMQGRDDTSSLIKILVYRSQIFKHSVIKC